MLRHFAVTVYGGRLALMTDGAGIGVVAVKESR